MAKYGLFKYGLAKYGLSGTVFKPIWNYTNKKSISNQNYRICKIEVLDKNDNIIGEIPQEDILSGSSTSFENQFGIHRNATINLYNGHNKYIPKYRDFIWLDKRFRIWSGTMINGVENWKSRGIYIIREVQTVNESGSNKYATLTMSDQFALLDGSVAGKLDATYIIPVNTYLHAAIRQTLSDAGITKNPMINCDNIQIYYTITKNAGDTYGEILEELANLISADCFFDKNGYLRFQSAAVDSLTDTSIKPSIYDLNAESIEYISGNHRSSFDSVRNYIMVISTNVQGATIQASASDTNVFSPYRVSLIGRRTEVVDNSNQYTTELCQTYANWMLYKKAIINESVDITSVYVDTLEENDVITITDESVGINHDRYLINSIQFPLVNEYTMTMNCWKIRTFN